MEHKLTRIVVTGVPEALLRGLKIKAISADTTVSGLMLDAVAEKYPDLVPLFKKEVHIEKYRDDAATFARVDRSAWRTPYTEGDGGAS